MRAGPLRHRLVLERPSESADAQGGVARAWEQVARIWAGLERVGAAEAYEHGRLASRSAWRITIRYRDDVTTAWRGRIGPRIFAFTGVGDQDGRRRALSIDAEETAS